MPSPSARMEEMTADSFLLLAAFRPFRLLVEDTDSISCFEVEYDNKIMEMRDIVAEREHCSFLSGQMPVT